MLLSLKTDDSLFFYLLLLVVTWCYEPSFAVVAGRFCNTGDTKLRVWYAGILPVSYTLDSMVWMNVKYHPKHTYTKHLSLVP